MNGDSPGWGRHTPGGKRIPVDLCGYGSDSAGIQRRAVTDTWLPPPFREWVGKMDQNPETNEARLRVAWLNSPDVSGEAFRRMWELLPSQGLDLQPVDRCAALADQGEPFALILLGVGEGGEDALRDQIEALRDASRLPLALLSCAYSYPHTMAALQGGADAVWTLGMPDDTLMARCRALLRRRL